MRCCEHIGKPQHMVIVARSGKHILCCFIWGNTSSTECNVWNCSILIQNQFQGQANHEASQPVSNMWEYKFIYVDICTHSHRRGVMIIWNEPTRSAHLNSTLSLCCAFSFLSLNICKRQHSMQVHDKDENHHVRNGLAVLRHRTVWSGFGKNWFLCSMKWKKQSTMSHSVRASRNLVEVHQFSQVRCCGLNGSFSALQQ